MQTTSSLTVPPPLHSNLQSLLGITNKSLDTYVCLFRLLQPCNLYIWFESMMQCLYFVYLDHRRKICHTILLRYGLAEHSLEMSLEESPDFKVPR